MEIPPSVSSGLLELMGRVAHLNHGILPDEAGLRRWVAQCEIFRVYLRDHRVVGAVSVQRGELGLLVEPATPLGVKKAMYRFV